MTAQVSARSMRRLASRVVSQQRRTFSDFYGPDVTAGASSSNLRLAFAASCMPHPEKIKRGGEDGFFACASSRTFGVADGVGGWSDAGVDPGEFARSLLLFAHEAMRRPEGDCEAELRNALLTSVARLHEEQIQGGTTALLGRLFGSTLALLNLGDSGAILLRPALRTPPGSDQPLLFPRVVFRSSDQTHYFNCPYQIGSGGAPAETPDFVAVRVQAGDLILAATDGVFDNLFDHQVQAIVARHLGSIWRSGSAVEPHLGGLANSIAEQAQRIGQREDHQDIITPFALSAHSEGLNFRGGKLDDTTIVIGLVSHDAEEEGGEREIPPLLHNFKETS